MKSDQNNEIRISGGSIHASLFYKSFPGYFKMLSRLRTMYRAGSPFKCMSGYTWIGASQVALVVKNLPTDVGDIKGMSSIPGWRRAWQPTPVFMLGESHRQPGRLQSVGSQRVGHDWSDLAHTTYLNRMEVGSFIFSSFLYTFFYNEDITYN